MNRKLIHISAAFLFANMSWGMAWPYLPNYMRILGGTMLFVALLSVLFNLTSSLGQYFWGRYSDRVGRRKPFVLSGLASSGMFFLLIGAVNSAVAVLILRTFQGFFVSAQTPAISAMVSEVSHNVGRGFGIFNLFSNIGFMLGNFAGGFVASHAPIRYVFILSSLPVLASVLILLPLREKGTTNRDVREIFTYYRPGRTVFSWRNSTRFIRENRNMVIFTLSVFAVMLASGMVYSYLSLLLENRFGEDFVGYYYGIDGLAASFLIYPFGYLADRYGSKIILIFSSLLYILTFILYFMAASIPLLIISAIVSGTKWASYFNSINTYAARMSSRENRATAIGLMNSGMSAGWVVGPLMGAYLVWMHGIPGMILLSSIPVAAGLLILLSVENDRYYRDGKRIY